MHMKPLNPDDYFILTDICEIFLDVCSLNHEPNRYQATFRVASDTSHKEERCEGDTHEQLIEEIHLLAEKHGLFATNFTYSFFTAREGSFYKKNFHKRPFSEEAARKFLICMRSSKKSSSMW